MTNLQIFCRQVRARSVENTQAMFAVRAIPGQMVAILRQELDSLVRVIFLLSQADQQYRAQLIDDSVTGTRWRHSNSQRPVTDREMVELTQRLHGWTKSVYDFGCAFIHLSQFHDHQDRDPLKQISEEEHTRILSHLRNYHGGPNEPLPKFSDIVPLLPRVLQKIADNLECYVKQLERGEILDEKEG